MLLSYPVLTFISRQIRIFHAHTEQIASGDMSLRLVVEYDDEIGQLMNAHNRMLDQIELLIRKEAEKESEVRRLELIPRYRNPASGV